MTSLLSITGPTDPPGAITLSLPADVALTALRHLHDAAGLIPAKDRLDAEALVHSLSAPAEVPVCEDCGEPSDRARPADPTGYQPTLCSGCAPLFDETPRPYSPEVDEFVFPEEGGSLR